MTTTATALPIWVTGSVHCKVCRGVCCKAYPGFYWPDQVSPFTAERIVSMVRDESCAIDCWESDIEPDGDMPQIWFLRPRIGNVPDEIDRAWGGTCCMLDAFNGCRLSPEKRPRQCLALIPASAEDRRANSGCHWTPGYEGGKEAAARVWRSLQDVICQAVHILNTTAVAS